MMTELIKGIITDILYDADEILDVMKCYVPDFLAGSLDYGQDVLLDLSNLINRL